MSSIYKWSSLSHTEQSDILKRATEKSKDEVSSVVSSIYQNIKDSGDNAVNEYSQKFDGDTFRKIAKQEFSGAWNNLSKSDPKLQKALELAIEQIRYFHSAQFPKTITTELRAGIKCIQKFIPLNRVGLYVPGGTAPLFSTLLMLAIPALVAKCPEIIICTPTNKNNKIDSTILALCDFLKLDDLYAIGGAQAIAAMAIGTETIPKVDKIFGPGNSWVTEAKEQVGKWAPGVSIDIPAGPSEVLVIADKNAIPEFVAWDLLGQAEHGTDSQSILVTDSLELIQKTKDLTYALAEKLPRKETILKSLENSRFILTKNIVEAINISNTYGPEHLIIQTEDCEKIVDQITSAGSVFLGKWTPESVGDYASGTNHVLPTNGWANSTSGVNLNSFFKAMTIQKLSKQGLNTIGPAVELMASKEGLDAHKNAVSCRLNRQAGE